MLDPESCVHRAVFNVFKDSDRDMWQEEPLPSGEGSRKSVGIKLAADVSDAENVFLCARSHVMVFVFLRKLFAACQLSDDVIKKIDV